MYRKLHREKFDGFLCYVQELHLVSNIDGILTYFLDHFIYLYKHIFTHPSSCLCICLFHCSIHYAVYELLLQLQTSSQLVMFVLVFHSYLFYFFIFFHSCCLLMMGLTTWFVYIYLHIQAFRNVTTLVQQRLFSSPLINFIWDSPVVFHLYACK